MTSEAIEMIKEEANKKEVEELYLDDISLISISVELKKEIEKHSEVACLSMNNCSLTTLANFPTKSNLIRLELMENKFPANDLNIISEIVSLQSLSLGSNKISSIDDLAPLKKLTNLIQLDLSDTELSKTTDYRANVFSALSQLQVLDNMDANGEEFAYTSEEDDDDNEDGYNKDDGDDSEEDDDEDDDDDEDEDDDDEDDEDDDGNDEDDEEDDDDFDEDEPASKDEARDAHDDDDDVDDDAESNDLQKKKDRPATSKNQENLKRRK
jgi:hypothetical protein